MSTKDGEPEIIVNGVRLSEGQAMTVRVALTAYHSEMSDPDALGDDEIGRGITAGYRARATEVLALMLAARTKPEGT